MSAKWTPEDRERKKRVIRNLSLSWLTTIQGNHPKTGKPCTKIEALEVLRGMRERIVTEYAKAHGSEVAARYRELFNEVASELAATAAD